MSNVIFIGDLHLRSTSPIARCDDYPNVILGKLESIANAAKLYKCKNIILLGDVFDTPITTLPYLATVLETFKKIKSLGITVYTIVGNHDIKNNRMDSLPTTALGILISSDYLKLAPNELMIENTLFRCFNYPDELSEKLTDNYEVCVAHQYYNFELSSKTLHEDDLIRLKYDAMVLGHYHAPCDTENIGNTILYRPGSLSRNTSEPYNKLRTPRFLLFNCKNHKAVYIDVACASTSDIFTDRIESNNCAQFSMKDLVRYITTSYASSDMNVRDYFNSLKIPYECRAKIMSYLDAVGA